MPHRSRLVLAAALAVAALAATATAANATFHLQKVNEVMLADSAGGTSVQFVELLDGGGPTESFPPTFAPYKLVVYDGAGHRLGAHTLSATKMAAAAQADRPYLISTPSADAALGVSGDEQLDLALPTAGGQACYTIQASETAYSCTTWGCVSHAVDASAGTGSAHGGVPPNGESAQRQADGSIQLAAPTPKAANRAGTAAPACPGGTRPNPGAQPGGFAGVTIARRSLELDRRGRAPVRLSCPAASGGCSGRVTIVAGRRPASVRFRLAAGHGGTVRVPLTRAERRLVKRRGRARARLKIDARDAAGTRKVTSATVTLRA
jgi:hypothetical protein